MVFSQPPQWISATLNVVVTIGSPRVRSTPPADA
jgi:hypothetical protein